MKSRTLTNKTNMDLYINVAEQDFVLKAGDSVEGIDDHIYDAFVRLYPSCGSDYDKEVYAVPGVPMTEEPTMVEAYDVIDGSVEPAVETAPVQNVIPTPTVQDVVEEAEDSKDGGISLKEMVSKAARRGRRREDEE